jgi:alkylation response protein AidB-like acyl-CoA dehydrogenase
VLEQAIFYEEMARARAPELPNAIGLDMAGPALIAHATEKQKQAHLPKILSAEHIFCQGSPSPMRAATSRPSRRARSGRTATT